jgi:hypothetical protein
MFKLTANDHVSDGDGDELFGKLFLAAVGGKALFEIRADVGKFDPGVCVEDILDVFQLVVVGNLVYFVEFSLHGLVVERVLLKESNDFFLIPDRNK